MEDQIPKHNSNFDKDDEIIPTMGFGSPYESFARPKAKIKSPIWEGDMINFQSNIEGVSKFEEPQQEYQVKYDIYGKAIIEHLNSPFTYHSGSTKDDSSRNNSHNKSSDKHSKTSLDNEGEEEVSEWTIEKENLDPTGSLLTPLKSKKKPFRGVGSISGNNAGRSPLQDITPPLGGKKKADTSTIEVCYLF